jgi:hypothetical protein
MRVAARPGAWACGRIHTHHTDPGDTVRDRDVAGPREPSLERTESAGRPWPRVAKREFERDGVRERERERQREREPERERERERETKTLGMHKERRV